MKLSLKKIKIFEEASDKSTCFIADLWVDDMCVAEVKNTGDGKPNVWKTVKYYQKFKPEEIAAKLANAQQVTNIDAWVAGVIREKMQHDKLAKTLNDDQKVIIDDITGEPVVVNKEKSTWKPKQSKMKTAKEKPDYSKLPWITLEHKGETYKVQHIGETNSHGKMYNKYQTKEGKIIHQKKDAADSKPAAKQEAKKPAPLKKGKVDVSDL